jgi:hypothetical protein
MFASNTSVQVADFKLDACRLRRCKFGTALTTISSRKCASSTSSAGLPKRRAADSYPCYASWPGPSWQSISLDRYTQSTLNVARHAKKSEVEGKIETQIEYQEVQEG